MISASGIPLVLNGPPANWFIPSTVLPGLLLLAPEYLLYLWSSTYNLSRSHARSNTCLDTSTPAEVDMQVDWVVAYAPA